MQTTIRKSVHFLDLEEEIEILCISTAVLQLRGS